MAENQVNEFRSKAEELADVESKMFRMVSSSSNLDELNHSRDGKTRLIVAAVVSVVAIVAALLLKGYLMFLFVVIAFIGLCELYVRFQEMRYHKERGTEYDSAMGDLDSAMTRRKQLIGELNGMRPEGDESRWWDANLLPIGMIVDVSSNPLTDWDFRLYFPIQLKDMGDRGILCSDFSTERLYCTADALAQNRSSEQMREIYCDESQLSSQQGYAVMAVYACRNEIDLTEVAEGTRVNSVDRNARMAEYRDKLDSFERTVNTLTGRTFLTDSEAFMAGQMDTREYLAGSTVRDDLERSYEKKLSSEGGQTKVYSEYYGGLEHGEYLLCAWLFIPMSGPTKVACILAPKGPQKLLSITWRAHSDDDLSGFLEDYAQYDALNTDTEILPDFEKVTEEIFTGIIGQKLSLNKRGVLAPRPHGLSDKEWCCVIWKDR
ncbi:MAG: hypothetical protein LUF81_02795 [Clostridiales bacterium]|nr:hypothetical protein [Clostridiales bacterium]